VARLGRGWNGANVTSKWSLFRRLTFASVVEMADHFFDTSGLAKRHA
jgi:hypothetical protein